MGTALGRRDRVRVRVHRLGVGTRPLHRDLEGDATVGVLRLEVDDLGVDELDLLHRVEVTDVVRETFVVAVRHGAVPRRVVVGVARQLVLVDLEGALVGERDLEALVEERHLLEAGAERLVVEDGRLEDRGVGPEGLRRAGLVGRSALAERSHGLAPVGEGLVPRETIALDLCLDTRRERVDDGDADAVESARDGVPAAAELAARVEDRHDDLDRGATLGRVERDRDAAAVVDDLDATIVEERDLDVVAVAGKCFVHSIVHNLVDEVVEPTLTRRADVHAGTLANRLKALEDRDRGGVVAGSGGRRGSRVRGARLVSHWKRCSSARRLKFRALRRRARAPTEVGASSRPRAVGRSAALFAPDEGSRASAGRGARDAPANEVLSRARPNLSSLPATGGISGLKPVIHSDFHSHDTSSTSSSTAACG